MTKPCEKNYKIKSLSKLMSYILRHRPDEFGLVLDEEGFIPLKELHWSITEEEGWSHISMADIQQAVYAVDRERFQIDGNRIRASYGHSSVVKIHYKPSVPPKTLYHGIRRKAYPSILRHGLRPMGHRYVHLTPSEELALRIGRRKDPNPILLTINARRANEEGIVFYLANELIYLVDALPVEYFSGPPLPQEKKEKNVKKKQEEDQEISEYVLFSRGLHPHKHWKGGKSKATSRKFKGRGYLPQKDR